VDSSEKSVSSAKSADSIAGFSLNALERESCALNGCLQAQYGIAVRQSCPKIFQAPATDLLDLPHWG
jgi:hypothetical protein